MSGDTFLSRIARWDGIRWTGFGGGMPMGLRALAQLPNGDILAGGESDPPRRSSPYPQSWWAPPTRAARWNGVSWSPYGPIVDGFVGRGEIQAIAILENGETVIGGTFRQSGGVMLNRVAHGWGDDYWAPFGAGFNEDVYALAVLPGGRIVAGGVFSMAGNVQANGVAQWNGSSWAAMGAGVGGEVRSLAVMGDGWLAAGSTAGVFLWNGTTWDTPGLGVDGFVSALAVAPDGRLIAGGTFRHAGGNPAYRIASWNGAAWSALGTSLADSIDRITSLHAQPSGDIIASGVFSRIGGVAANNIARWDGHSWSALGEGLDSAAYTIFENPAGDLFLGGVFNQAGGRVSPHFARYIAPSADFDRDGDVGTDADIGAFFECLAGTCCPWCGTADFNGDGDIGTDADIEAFFRVLAGGPC